MLKNSILISIIFFAVTAAHAQNQTEALTLDQDQVEKPITDLDKEVTDIKLRANSGAKSKFSSSLFFNYAGAALTKPFGFERPNPGGQRLAEPVSVAGNVGLRYRKNKNESFFLATGFYQEKPLHSHTKEQQLDISTPQITYNNTFALEDIQVSAGAQLYITTQDYMRKIGDLGSLGFSLSSVSVLGQSRWSGGMSILARVTAFDKDDRMSRAMQSDYGFTLTPVVQFNPSDRWNLFTSVNILNYYHYRSERATDLTSIRMSQSLGMGVAVFRDLYLAPNLTFEPEKISSKGTAVNLSASINL